MIRQIAIKFAQGFAIVGALVWISGCEKSFGTCNNEPDSILSWCLLQSGYSLEAYDRAYSEAYELGRADGENAFPPGCALGREAEPGGNPTDVPGW